MARGQVRPGMMAARLVEPGDILVSVEPTAFGRGHVRVVGTVLTVLQASESSGYSWRVRNQAGVVSDTKAVVTRNVWVHVRAGQS